MNILITGSNGFVGENLKFFFKTNFPNYKLFFVERGNSKEPNHISWENIENGIPESINIIIHLAGKAHDLKNVSKPQEYYEVNTELTKKIYDQFLSSNAHKFIFISTCKAAADEIQGILTETHIANPITHYGKSKLLAENYIINQNTTNNKKYFILRPCMIYGEGNKGNLNLLYQLVKKGIPWPLGAFNNKRSFCNIENLNFVIQELIDKENIASGIYNIADNESLSTNEIIQLIAESKNKKASIWHIPKSLITALAKLGDKMKLPLNTERLQKLTASYLVDNSKIKLAIGKNLPFSTREGLLKTFQSFNK
jgi:nucleoside-diphosphate-sugar epimerase